MWILTIFIPCDSWTRIMGRYITGWWLDQSLCMVFELCTFIPEKTGTKRLPFFSFASFHVRIVSSCGSLRYVCDVEHHPDLSWLWCDFYPSDFQKSSMPFKGCSLFSCLRHHCYEISSCCTDRLSAVSHDSHVLLFQTSGIGCRIIPRRLY